MDKSRPYKVGEYWYRNQGKFCTMLRTALKNQKKNCLKTLTYSTLKEHLFSRHDFQTREEIRKFYTMLNRTQKEPAQRPVLAQGQNSTFSPFTASRRERRCKLGGLIVFVNWKRALNFSSGRRWLTLGALCNLNLAFNLFLLPF